MQKRVMRFSTLYLLLLPMLGIAQELTPRAYWPAPTGTQLISVGVSQLSGDSIPDPSLPLTGVDSSITTGSVSYRQTTDWFGRSTNVILQLPYSAGETETEHLDLGVLQREYQGVGDFSATVSVNLMGAPAMNREQFSQMRQNPKPIVGASVKLVAPTGRYDADRVVNVGTNRWAMKAEVGSIVVLSPKWLLELEAGAWLFQDNDDFLGFRKQQDPIYSLELHLVRRISPGFWVSLDANGYRGGRSTVGVTRLEDLQRDSKLGATMVFPFAKKHAIKVGYSTGSVNDSSESFDVFQLVYTQVL